MRNKSGINEKNRKLLDSLSSFKEKIFSIRDASEMMELPIKDTRLYLAYFARRGWLARIKRGLYISVPLGIVNPQEYKENPWVVANKIFSPCYIGGWSAAEHWDLTEQIFNTVYVFTFRTFRNKNISVNGTEFVLRFIGGKRTRHIKGVWVENTKIQISDPEQTLVDILNDPAAGGGIRHVAEIIRNYFDSDYSNGIKLLGYIKESRNRTIYKRLGYILEILNIQNSEIIKECHKNISTGYSLLDHTISSKGTFSRRWNLQVNAEIAR